MKGQRGLVGLFFILSLAHLPAEETVVCEAGKPILPVLTGSTTEPVRELQTYLNRITGAQFQVAPGRPGKAGLFVGLATDFPWLNLGNVEALGYEGFILKSDGKSIYLVGQEPLGVQRAVTTFLHEIGCRWFFPGSVWEVMPSKKTIAGSWDVRQKPSFPSQRRIWYGYGTNAKNEKEKEEWDRHNRMGGLFEIRIGHTWHGLDPKKDFDQHPEWFALSNGKRQPSKPCYSHPAVIQRAIDYALRQAANGNRVISMSPPDGLGYCECERCRAIFQGATPSEDHGTLFAKRPDGLVVNITSESFFHVVNEVAKAVGEKYPDVLVGTYAYSAYSHPPSFDLRPNVFIQTSTSFRRTSLSREEQIAAFGKRTRHLGIRDYYSVYQWDWDYPSVAKGSLFLPQLVSDLRFFRENGVTAINAEASNNWGPRGLGYYVAARLMWDVNTDVKELVRDFYEKAFGPAAQAMERYYVRWYGTLANVSDRQGSIAKISSPSNKSEKTQDELDHTEPAVAASFNRDSIKASFQDLDEAARLVKDLAGYRERVDSLRMYMHYLILRLQLEETAKGGDREEVVEAIKAETIFGARLMNTNMIHSRPLLGKAFHRRFRDYMKYLQELPEGQETKGLNKGFRSVRDDVPTHRELDELWAADRKVLGL